MSIGEEFSQKYRAIPYPERPKRPVREDFPSHTAYGKAMDEWEELLVQHKAALEAHSAAERAVEEEFKQAIAKEFGLEGHPKFEQMYAIAYEQGHSDGLDSVYWRCEVLASLLQD